MIKISNKTLGETFLYILADILFFPFWWYSVGLLKFYRHLLAVLKEQEKFWSWSVWIKNIFTPMYGLRDWQGMLISFFIRLFQIIFRTAIMAICLLILTAVLLIYLIFPIFALYEIFFQLK
jgi:hypothetical protein